MKIAIDLKSHVRRALAASVGVDKTKRTLGEFLCMLPTRYELAVLEPPKPRHDPDGLGGLDDRWFADGSRIDRAEGNRTRWIAYWSDGTPLLDSEGVTRSFSRRRFAINALIAGGEGDCLEAEVLR